ncbi:ABC transporter permease [Myceligenerans indicum]|uniref:Transport permease protein n=1 Tax=Myceligenerans indicum TaxID=2593663 RepID=A0ABS1LI88_9MICO|nr:ABC transporter permease [Myceligenerans indicum]MBL0885859.1 ABC transporter permease [Myceligenerans indicum]
MTTPTTAGAAAEARPKPPQPPEPIEFDLTSEERLALAEQNGLTRMGVRPPLWSYIRDVIRHWQFIRVLGASTAYSKNQNNYLGQLWAVLNPFLNAIIYVVIFGLVLGASRGVANTVAFIVMGTFMFRFIDTSVHGGARSIASKSSLLRNLHFPRAVMPISEVYSQLATLIPALGVMVVMVLLSGFIPAYEPVRVTWWWTLFPLAIVLLWIFNMGLAFIVARVTAATPDMDNIISFVLRLAMFASGAIFPITRFVDKLPPSAEWFGMVMEYQPGHVYLYLGRSMIMQEKTIPPDLTMWYWGIGWAIFTFALGFIVFWRGEEKYGRD